MIFLRNSNSKSLLKVLALALLASFLNFLGIILHCESKSRVKLHDEKAVFWEYKVIFCRRSRISDEMWEIQYGGTNVLIFTKIVLSLQEDVSYLARVGCSWYKMQGN